MIILVTNRKLCQDDFLLRINQLAKGKPHAIMLREKDLNENEYAALADKIKEICKHNQIQLIINQNISAASKLKLGNIQLSMVNLRKYQRNLEAFTQIGASVHSLAEAKEAQQLGASYLIAGHIYSTDCKKGVPPRGLSFLKEIVDSVEIPVFAIGGITKEKGKDIMMTGAKGICVMSEAMTCTNPGEFAGHFQI